MADNDDHDDNIVPFPRYEVTLEEDTVADANTRTGLSYFLDDFDHVVVVGWNEEEGRMDVIDNVGDPATLYELLQQAAANIAMEALEGAFQPTRH